MTKASYSKGDAAAFAAWLEQQDQYVGPLAAQFRPWEIYKLQGREIFVRVVDYEADNHASLLYVQYLDPRYENRVVPVTPGQIELWGVLGFEELPVVAKVA